MWCKFGTLAPPADRPAPGATPRISCHQRHVWCHPKPTGTLPTCAVTALPRRPHPGTPGGGAATADAGTSGGTRATQLYDLDREGAFAGAPSTSDASPAAAAAASSGGDGSAFLDDGWGVVAVGGSSSSYSSATAAGKPVAKRDKRKQKKQLQAAAAMAAAAAAPASQRPVATPFFDKSSEAGIIGLSLLQARLAEEGREEHDAERKARTAAEGAARREQMAKSVRRKRDWVDPDDLDVGEGEAEEMALEQSGQQQYFEFNLEADGSTEVVEFDDQGRVATRRAPGTGGGDAAAASRRKARRGGDDDDDDPLAFLADLDDDNGLVYDDDSDGEGLYDEEEDGRGARRAASGAAAGPSRRAAAPVPAPTSRRGRTSLYDEDDEEEEDDYMAADRGRRPLPGKDPIADEEVEWGLDELGARGRPSLMQELGVIRKKKDPKKAKQQQQPKQQQQQLAGKGKGSAAVVAAQGAKPGTAAAPAAAAADEFGDDEEEEEGEERDVGVAWGGSGGASGIDMEQQEALLRRLYKPHKVKELMAHQRAAEAELAAMKRKASGRHVLESKVHSRMRIIAGSAAGRQLASSQGATTRPMMEKVRQAIFNMIQAQAGSGGGLPEQSRWLDFFAGTGSVGLEALSRGSRECHFIELDPWVCRKVLSRNIATCGFQRRAVIHTMKAEDFLRRSIELPRFAGGAFDFISVCPPYLVVSYPELMDLLERSPLLHDRSIVFVEYPKQLAHQVPRTLGPLVQVRDRKYGRTFIRVYGPAGGPADGADEDGGSASGADEDEDELLLL